MIAWGIVLGNSRKSFGTGGEPPKEPRDNVDFWTTIIALVIGISAILAIPISCKYNREQNTQWVREYTSEYQVIYSDWNGKYVRVDIQEVGTGQIFRDAGRRGISRSQKNPYELGQYYVIIRNDFLVYGKPEYEFNPGWVKTTQK